MKNKKQKIIVTSANKPDPELVGKAFAPLILKMVEEKIKRLNDEKLVKLKEEKPPPDGLR